MESEQEHREDPAAKAVPSTAAVEVSAPADSSALPCTSLCNPRTAGTVLYLPVEDNQQLIVTSSTGVTGVWHKRGAAQLKSRWETYWCVHLTCRSAIASTQLTSRSSGIRPAFAIA